MLSATVLVIVFSTLESIVSCSALFRLYTSDAEIPESMRVAIHSTVIFTSVFLGSAVITSMGLFIYTVRLAKKAPERLAGQVHVRWLWTQLQIFHQLLQILFCRRSTLKTVHLVMVLMLVFALPWIAFTIHTGLLNLGLTVWKNSFDKYASAYISFPLKCLTVFVDCVVIILRNGDIRKVCMRLCRRSHHSHQTVQQVPSTHTELSAASEQEQGIECSVLTLDSRE